VKLGVITDEVSQSIREAAVFAKHFGLTGLELRSVNDRGPFAWTDEDVEEIKRTAAEFGLEICAISSPLFKCDMDDEAAVKEHIAGFRRCAENARKLGCTIIRGFDFWKNGASTEKRAEYFEKIVDICEKFGVYCALENEPATNGGTPAKVYELVKAIASLWVKVLFDPGNTFFYSPEEQPFPDDYERVKDEIIHVHIKDSLCEGGKPKAVCIGTGWVDYPGFISELRRDKYDGYMCLETHYRHSAELDESQLNLPGGMAFSVGAASASAESMAAFRELLK